MSEKEKELLEGIAKLPDKLQDKFVEHLTIAAMVLDTMAAQQGGADQEGGNCQNDKGWGGK